MSFYLQTCEEELLFIILKDCPDLECLSLEGNFSNFLSDRFFAKVMSTNPFGNLRIFDVQGTQVPLTIATANCFLRLPSLQELRVSCWRLSEQGTIHILRKRFYSTKLNLTYKKISSKCNVQKEILLF